MTVNNKVSVIIPCYNQGKYVLDAINSVLNQTYDNIEIICINDGSTDNSSEIIKSIAEKYKTILFIENKDNKGVIVARNTAIEASNGEYILPLDADDTIEPTYIEKAVKVLDEKPNIGIVYCKARMFGNKNKYWDLEDFNKSNILYENCIFCSALFRKKDFIKVGKYKDYMLYGCEDYDLWLSFIELGLDVYKIDEILFNYRQYEEISRTKINLKNQEKVWKALLKNHINMYVEDKKFWEKFFYNPEVMTKKYKKYKKLFSILLILALLELLIIATLFYLYF